MSKYFFQDYPKFVNEVGMKEECENADLDFIKCKRNLYHTFNECKNLNKIYINCLSILYHVNENVKNDNE